MVLDRLYRDFPRGIGLPGLFHRHYFPAADFGSLRLHRRKARNVTRSIELHAGTARSARRADERVTVLSVHKCQLRVEDSTRDDQQLVMTVTI